MMTAAQRKLLLGQRFREDVARELSEMSMLMSMIVLRWFEMIQVKFGGRGWRLAAGGESRKRTDWLRLIR